MLQRGVAHHIGRYGMCASARMWPHTGLRVPGPLRRAALLCQPRVHLAGWPPAVLDLDLVDLDMYACIDLRQDVGTSTSAPVPEQVYLTSRHACLPQQTMHTPCCARIAARARAAPRAGLRTAMGRCCSPRSTRPSQRTGRPTRPPPRPSTTPSSPSCICPPAWTRSPPSCSGCMHVSRTRARLRGRTKQ